MQEMTIYEQTVDIFIIIPKGQARAPCAEKCLQQTANASRLRLRWDRAAVHVVESEHMKQVSRSSSGRYNLFALVGSDVIPRDQQSVRFNVVGVALPISLGRRAAKTNSISVLKLGKVVHLIKVMAHV